MPAADVGDRLDRAGGEGRALPAMDVAGTDTRAADGRLIVEAIGKRVVDHQSSRAHEPDPDLVVLAGEMRVQAKIEATDSVEQLRAYECGPAVHCRADDLALREMELLARRGPSGANGHISAVPVENPQVPFEVVRCQPRVIVDEPDVVPDRALETRIPRCTRSGLLDVDHLERKVSEIRIWSVGARARGISVGDQDLRRGHRLMSKVVQDLREVRIPTERRQHDGHAWLRGNLDVGEIPLAVIDLGVPAT
jgi:hypothetical protein